MSDVEKEARASRSRLTSSPLVEKMRRWQNTSPFGRYVLPLLFILIAFTAAVMGGIGNLRGALLGGLIIGCIQQISDNRTDWVFGIVPIGPDWTPAIVFAYLVLIMVFRPQGLLGDETREAG